MSLDSIFVALGAAASLGLRLLQAFVPPLRRWFDRQADEDKQALTLLIGVVIVAGMCGYRMWGQAMPADAGALGALLVQCVTEVLATWAGIGATHTATKLLGSGGTKSAVSSVDAWKA